VGLCEHDPKASVNVEATLIVTILSASLLLVLTVWRRRETRRLKHAPLSVGDVAG
jgi:hypothetical protein